MKAGGRAACWKDRGPKMSTKEELRQVLGARWEEKWPSAGEALRPPAFAGAGRAAERLRRLPQYQMARVIAILPDPALLQARINALGDGKTLIAATPGLKQGLVRIAPDQAPLPSRVQALAGNSLAQTGQVLRFPKAKAGKVDLVVGAALAVDRQGWLLGDGRGLLDLLYALLAHLKAISPARTPVLVLVDDEQVVKELPHDTWDLRADLVVTPSQVISCPGPGRAPSLGKLPPALAHLPLVQAILGQQSRPATRPARSRPRET